MNKKIIIPFLAILLVGSVFAGVYYFNSLSIEFNINEPFTSYYKETSESCMNVDPSTYIELSSNSQILQDMMPGEIKKICLFFKSDALETIGISHSLSGNSWGMVEIIEDTIPIELDPTSSNTVNVGHLKFKAKSDSIGQFDGTVDIGR